jgi:hypothetical protein
MSHGVATIPGLHYQAAYLTAAEQHQLLTAIDQQPWLTDLKRRGGACVMTFTRVSDGSQVSLLLEPGSLLVLTGAARYAWKHGIPARKTDMYQGQVLPRRRRISVTLRTIITPDM